MQVGFCGCLQESDSWIKTKGKIVNAAYVLFSFMVRVTAELNIFALSSEEAFKISGEEIRRGES
jgi:hypothetical protein